MNKLALFLKLYFVQPAHKQRAIAQVTNPSLKQRCLYRVPLPLAQGITSNWPANPYPWRRHQGIQKHHFTRRNKYGFDKCLLLFAPVISNYPDIEDICITIGRMTALPFTKLKRSALELNRPVAAIDMNDQDIGDAIRLGEPLRQSDHRVRKLFSEPVCKDQL